MTAVPTIKEELERKTLDAIVDIVSRLERGVVDNRTAWVEAKTIWGVICGLVSSELSEHAAQIANDLNQEAIRRVFIHKSKPTLLMQIIPNRVYAITRVNPENNERIRVASKKFEPGEHAEVVNAAVDRLKGVGYIEI